jgi:glycerol-3-phosphate O-acyltransferase
MTDAAPPTNKPHPDAPWPATGPVIVVALDEREMVEEWVDRARPAGDPVEVVTQGDPRLAEVLSRGEGDPWVAPVGVVKVPTEGEAGLASRLLGALPVDRLLPERLRVSAPDNRRVVAAEPARVSELRQRWNESGDESFVAFVTRQAVLAFERAQRQLLGSQHKVPRLVSEDLLASRRFREGVARLAKEHGRAEAEVAAEASRYLGEMVASQSALALEWWERIGRWVARAYTFQVEGDRLEELREANRKHGLVFLPGHRSYLDPVVLRSVLHDHAFPPNHIFGGINVSFWPLGPFAKRSGHVFIRRSIRDNPVYKFTLREYMGYLVRKRFNLEWYIEGGRTRTGKLRPPAYGLLAYLIEALKTGAAEDVCVVPTSIVYDQLHEIGAMAAEAHGGAKQSEGLGWLVNYARSQGRRLGAVRVSFGPPMSLRQALEEAEESGDGVRRSHPVEKVAFEISHRINETTPITPNSLVTLALLGFEDRALTFDEILSILDPLLTYVERRGLPVTAEFTVSRPEGIRAALDALTRNGVLTCVADGVEPVWGIVAGRHLEAAFYRNSAIHFFVNRAILELALARAAEGDDGDDPLTVGWDDALSLRDLLKFEFFFARKQSFMEELRQELDILDSTWEERREKPHEAWSLLVGARVHVADRVLRSFLEAYLVVSERLARRAPEAPWAEAEFLNECLGVARQYRMQRRLESAEAVSKELFRTALQLAGNRDLLEPGAEDLAQRRRAFAGEVKDVVNRLDRIRHLALAELDAGATAGA